MIACPNPDCTAAELEAFEVYALYGVTGPRLYVDCPGCDRRFEVEVLVQN